MSGSRAGFFAPALFIMLAMPLAGCTTTSDPVAAVVTRPGQYDLYDCPAIKVAAVGVRQRQHEVAGLMARAERGPLGGMVNATTYRPEYVTLRGKMDQLRRVAAEKHCNFDPATVPVTQSPQRRRVAPLPPPPKRGAKSTVRR